MKGPELCSIDGMADDEVVLQRAFFDQLSLRIRQRRTAHGVPVIELPEGDGDLRRVVLQDDCRMQ